MLVPPAPRATARQGLVTGAKAPVFSFLSWGLNGE